MPTGPLDNVLLSDAEDMPGLLTVLSLFTLYTHKSRPPNVANVLSREVYLTEGF